MNTNTPINKPTWAERRAIASSFSHKAAPFINETVVTPEQARFTEAQLLALDAGLDSLDVRASEFIYGVKDELRYVQSRGMWLYWDDTVWRWDTSGKAQELVKDFGRSFAMFEKAVTDDERKRRMRWYKELTEPKGINSILTLAQTDPILAANIEHFDAGVIELNTPAGVVNLKTGELSAPTAARLVRRSTAVAPDANCKTPLYDNLLSEAFMGQPALSDYFEKMMGVTLFKGQQEQVFMYMFGKAGSGKGTLMNIAKDILGTGDTGYAAYVDADLFVASRNKQHPTEMMQFLGARMVISSEITQGQKMDTGKLKRTTGGDSITGRYMNKDYVTFDPTHTLWLMANDRLQVPHDDQGVWRRLRVLPFDFAKSESEQASGLLERILTQEAPGILARWITKATEYANEGISTPNVVLDARKEYIEDQDTVQAWLDHCADTSKPGAFSAGMALRESYSRWCRQEDLAPVGIKKFAQALEAKGHMRAKQTVPATTNAESRQVRGFTGISLHGVGTLSVL